MAGGVKEQYEYDAFGKAYFYNGTGQALPNGSSFGNRFLFKDARLHGPYDDAETEQFLSEWGERYWHVPDDTME